MCLDTQPDDRRDLDHCTFVINGGPFGEPTRLQVVGSLDTRSTAGLLALTRGLEGDVDVDLSRCRFLDAAGVGGLLSVAQSVRSRGGACTLTGACNGVERVLRLTGVDEFMGAATSRTASRRHHPAGSGLASGDDGPMAS